MLLYWMFIRWHEWWVFLGWFFINWQGSPNENDNDVLENLDTKQSVDLAVNEAHNEIRQVTLPNHKSYHTTDDKVSISIRLAVSHINSYDTVTEKSGVITIAEDAKTEIDALNIFFYMINHHN